MSDHWSVTAVRTNVLMPALEPFMRARVLPSPQQRYGIPAAASPECVEQACARTFGALNAALAEAKEGAPDGYVELILALIDEHHTTRAHLLATATGLAVELSRAPAPTERDENAWTKEGESWKHGATYSGQESWMTPGCDARRNSRITQSDLTLGYTPNAFPRGVFDGDLEFAADLGIFTLRTGGLVDFTRGDGKVVRDYLVATAQSIHVHGDLAIAKGTVWWHDGELIVDGSITGEGMLCARSVRLGGDLTIAQLVSKSPVVCRGESRTVATVVPTLPVPTCGTGNRDTVVLPVAMPADEPLTSVSDALVAAYALDGAAIECGGPDRASRRISLLQNAVGWRPEVTSWDYSEVMPLRNVALMRWCAPDTADEKRALGRAFALELYIAVSCPCALPERRAALESLEWMARRSGESHFMHWAGACRTILSQPLEKTQRMTLCELAAYVSAKSSQEAHQAVANKVLEMERCAGLYLMGEMLGTLRGKYRASLELGGRKDLPFTFVRPLYERLGMVDGPAVDARTRWQSVAGHRYLASRMGARLAARFARDGRPRALNLALTFPVAIGGLVGVVAMSLATGHWDAAARACVNTMMFLPVARMLELAYKASLAREVRGGGVGFPAVLLMGLSSVGLHVAITHPLLQWACLVGLVVGAGAFARASDRREAWLDERIALADADAALTRALADVSNAG